MGDFNRVQLIGRLGRDPESRNTQSGSKIVTFSMATSERWKDKNTGEQKDRTQWHRVVIYNENLATVAERFLTKGQSVMIVGEIEYRKYTDQSGNEKEITEIVLKQGKSEIVLLDKSSDSGQSSAPQSAKPASQSYGSPTWDKPKTNATANKPKSNAPAYDDMSNDVPF
jgi:single-strand DNA-binding protein